jgi:hypothetical protein
VPPGAGAVVVPPAGGWVVVPPGAGVVVVPPAGGWVVVSPDDGVVVVVVPPDDGLVVVPPSFATALPAATKSRADRVPVVDTASITTVPFSIRAISPSVMPELFTTDFVISLSVRAAI